MWIKPDFSSELVSFIYFLHPFFSLKKFKRKKKLMAEFTAELYLVHVEHFNSELPGIGSYLTPQDLVMSP